MYADFSAELKVLWSQDARATAAVSGQSFCSDHQMTLRFTQPGQYGFYKYYIFQDLVFSCTRDNPSEELIQSSIPSIPSHPFPLPHHWPSLTLGCKKSLRDISFSTDLLSYLMMKIGRGCNQTVGKKPPFASREMCE